MHPSLVLLVVLQGAPIVQPISTVCEDVQRIELSLEHGASPEVCVSPGLLTGFVFDSRVVVDLEAEIRFAEVTRGNTSLSPMPPGDAQEGERFRLMAHFPDGASATTVLVVHRGRATRQVEVYRRLVSASMWRAPASTNRTILLRIVDEAGLRRGERMHMAWGSQKRR